MKREDPHRFWARVPFSALWPLVLAVFLTFAAFGFLVDVGNQGRHRPGILAALVALSGTVAVAYLLISVRRKLWLLAVVVPLQAGCRDGWTFSWRSAGPSPWLIS